MNRKTDNLHDYLYFRQQHEKTPFNQQPGYLEPLFRLSMRNFAGVELDDAGSILADTKSPNVLAAYLVSPYLTNDIDLGGVRRSLLQAIKQGMGVGDEFEAARHLDFSFAPYGPICLALSSGGINHPDYWRIDIRPETRRGWYWTKDYMFVGNQDKMKADIATLTLFDYAYANRNDRLRRELKAVKSDSEARDREFEAWHLGHEAKMREIDDTAAYIFGFLQQEKGDAP